MTITDCVFKIFYHCFYILHSRTAVIKFTGARSCNRTPDLVIGIPNHAGFLGTQFYTLTLYSK